MARKRNLYRLLRHCTPRNDDFDESYIEIASPRHYVIFGEHRDATAIAVACSESNHPKRVSVE